MQGVGPALRSQSFTSAPSSASGLSQEPLTRVQVLAANTGRRVDFDAWAENVARRQRMEDDTRRIADVLERHGWAARRRDDLTLLGSCTSAYSKTEGYANWNILPLVAQRNRAPMLRSLQWFFEQEASARRYARYMVWTSGQRLPLYSPDLRLTCERQAHGVSRFAEWLRRRDVEIYFRSSEVTVDHRLTVHPHTNLVLHPRRKLSSDEWAEVLDKAREISGGWVKDCGRIEDLREICKYVFKGDDLGVLLDAAESSYAWGSGQVSEDLVGHLVPRLRDELKRDGVGVDHGILRGHAEAIGRRLADELDDVADEGKPHPVVWLHEQLQGLHLVQALGPFRSIRSELRQARQRVVVHHTARGPRLALEQREILRGDRLDDDRHPEERDTSLEVRVWEMWEQFAEEDHGWARGHIASALNISFKQLKKILQTPKELWELKVGGRQVSGGGFRENQVVAQLPPSARFTPWAEPLLLVLNYTQHPKTRAGEKGLEQIASLQQAALRHWYRAEAPAPSAALRRGVMVKSAFGLLAPAGPAPAGAGDGGPQGSFIVHTCTTTPRGEPPDGGPPPDDPGAEWRTRNDGTIWNPETGEILDLPSLGERWSEMEADLDSVGGLEWWDADAAGWDLDDRPADDIPF